MNNDIITESQVDPAKGNMDWGGGAILSKNHIRFLQ